MLMSMTTNAAHPASALDTVLLFARVRAELVRDVDRAVSGHSLGFSDLALVRLLAAAPGHRMRRSDLAHALGVTASAVARQVAPLERIGIVARESNPKDARLALVVLTDAGVRVEQEASAAAAERASSVLDRTWTADEQASLADLLARVTTR
jgi:DNA-binding MarR family transcriptional regulator